MATWSPGNFVITNEGEKVLSSVIIGIDRLTITRIVTGAGYVAPSALYKQTAVTNPKQEMQVTNVATNSNGSEVTVRVTNEGVNEPYPIYQIGVYVTHPDFEGEVLYMLAQCDTATPDYMPAREEVPVSFTYSLYIAHSGTDKVTITVSDAGLLPTSVFLKYKVDIEDRFEQITTEINKRSLKGHKHTMSDVTDLKDALDKKANIDHTHNNYIDKNSKADEATEDKSGMLSDIDKSWINGKFQRYYYGEDGTTADKLGYYKIASFTTKHSYMCAGMKLRVFSENFANFARIPFEFEVVFRTGVSSGGNGAFIYAEPNSYSSSLITQLFIKYTTVNNTTSTTLVDSICEIYWKRDAVYQRLEVEVLSEYDRSAYTSTEWGSNFGVKGDKYRKVWKFDTTNTPIAAIEEDGYTVYMFNNYKLRGNASAGTDATPIYFSSGKPIACKHNFNEYLPLTGGTVTGETKFNVAPVYFDGKNYRTPMQVFDDGDEANLGAELCISGGGNTFIGGGESHVNLRADFQAGNLKSGEVYSANAERTYVSANSELFFYSNCQTVANRKGIAFAGDGVLYPHIVGQAINIGRPAAPFAHIYANNFHGALEGNVKGNASTADKLKTARKIAIAGAVTGAVNFDGSANITINTFRRATMTGQNTNTADALSKPWFKVFSYDLVGNSDELNIVFFVTYADCASGGTSTYNGMSFSGVNYPTKTGILHFSARTTTPKGGTKAAYNVYAQWKFANAGIEPANFVALSIGTVVELWVKCPRQWECAEFVVLSESHKTLTNTVTLTYNKSAGSQAALPTGTTACNPSTLTPILNPIALPVTTTDPAAIQGEMWIKK